MTRRSRTAAVAKAPTRSARVRTPRVDPDARARPPGGLDDERVAVRLHVTPRLLELASIEDGMVRRHARRPSRRADSRAPCRRRSPAPPGHRAGAGRWRCGSVARLGAPPTLDRRAGRIRRRSPTRPPPRRRGARRPAAKRTAFGVACRRRRRAGAPARGQARRASGGRREMRSWPRVGRPSWLERDRSSSMVVGGAPSNDGRSAVTRGRSHGLPFRSVRAPGRIGRKGRMQYQEGIIGHRNRSTSVGPCAGDVPTTYGAEVV